MVACAHGARRARREGLTRPGNLFEEPGGAARHAQGRDGGSRKASDPLGSERIGRHQRSNDHLHRARRRLLSRAIWLRLHLPARLAGLDAQNIWRQDDRSWRREFIAEPKTGSRSSLSQQCCRAVLICASAPVCHRSANAEFKTVNGSAHMIFWEKPAETCSAIVEFLRCH